MTDLNQMFSNPDSVILSQLFSVLNESFKCKGGVYGILKTLSSGMVKILASLVVQKMFRNSSDIFGVIRFLMMRIIYRKIHLNSSEKSLVTIEEFKKFLPPVVADSKKTINEPIISSITISGIPVYLDKEGAEHILYIFPYIHDKFIRELENIVNNTINERGNINTICKDTTGKTFVPLDLFASNNYIQLDNVISSYFDVQSDTKMLTPPLVVINGNPGLGKSNSVHYIGRLGKYGEVRHIDLTASGMVNKSFSAIVSEIIAKKTTVTTIIYFDELDKYVDLYTQHAFTAKSVGKLEESGNNMDEIVDSNYEIFRISVKKSVITTITQLNSNFANFTAGVVFIFCTNNFHTLFEGIDQTHVESAKTRFTFIEFKMCNKEEFARYIRVFNDRVKNPKIKYSEERLNECINKINPNLNITYRNIQICQTRAAYDIATLVEYINSNIYNPLLSPTIEPERKVEGTRKIETNLEKLKTIPIIDKIVDRKTSREEKKKQKENNKKLVRDIINIVEDRPFDDDNEECMCKVLKIAEGYDLVELSETIITESAEEGYYLSIIFSICSMGRNNLLEYLINLGVDVDITLPTNYNLLHYCIQALKFTQTPSSVINQNIFECIKLLVDNDIDMYLENNDGCKPLGLFLETHNVAKTSDIFLDIIKLLVFRGFNINTRLDSNGDTILKIALDSSFSRNIILEIISLGANVNLVDECNNNLLCRMCHWVMRGKDNSETIKLLIELGADVNFINKRDNMSPLHYLVRQNKKECIPSLKLLLDSGANKVLKNKMGETISIESLTKCQELIDFYNSY